MNQAEPEPLPGQPERRRWGQRAWLRLGRPDASPARPGIAGPGGPRPGSGRPGDGQPGEDRVEAGLAPASQPADCPEPLPDATLDSDHPVVVGYDGSEASRHALAYAVGMARRLGHSLLVTYVAMPGVFCEPLTGQVIAPNRDSQETQRWLLAELDEICDRAGLDVRLLTRQGSPARELAAVADEFTADALVIGAPAHAWHHLAGSVPGWLARHARCPVIVVP